MTRTKHRDLPPAPQTTHKVSLDQSPNWPENDRPGVQFYVGIQCTDPYDPAVRPHSKTHLRLRHPWEDPICFGDTISAGGMRCKGEEKARREDEDPSRAAPRHIDNILHAAIGDHYFQGTAGAHSPPRPFVVPTFAQQSPSRGTNHNPARLWDAGPRDKETSSARAPPSERPLSAKSGHKFNR